MSVDDARALANRIRSNRNLIAGGVGSGLVSFDDEGIARYANLITLRYKENERGLLQHHVRRSQDLYRLAEGYFTAEVRRPTSSGDRSGERMTGRFTFGSGQTFQASVIEDKANTVYGIGFPKVDVADARTDFVWRALEFGLPGTEHGSASPEGPQGFHRLPASFHWDPATGRGARLVLGRDPKDRFRKKGARNTRVRRKNVDRGAGFEAKNRGQGFIRPAMRDMSRQLPREYSRLFAQSFGRIR
jgi:hypothetical protein